MTLIRKQDFIDSIADACQYISYYHPIDFIQAMGKAYEKEQSPAARNAIAQILVNSRMAAEGHRPICQDTGMICAFVKIGMQVQWDSDLTVTEMVNEGVRIAYSNPDNPLRASVVTDPAGSRKNTKDNTPAVVHIELVPGHEVEVIVAAKGFGSEHKSKFTVLNPNDSVVNWVLDVVPQMGAGWCPPGILGIGLGGTAEKALLLAKEALMEPINIQDLLTRGPQNKLEEMRLEIYDKVNALGIGAQGLGGLTTVLDIKIKEYPTHAASLPVGIIPNCASTRHVHFTLDGTGPAQLQAPSMTDWPQVTWEIGKDVRKVNLDNLSRDDIQSWKAGEMLLISGKILTGRDAAHNRIATLFAQGKSLPETVDLKNRFIYYVGPVPATKTEVIGSAGPTTATRMDKFTDMMLEKTGILGMIGKAERGPATVDSIKKHKAVYLIAVGGAGYLVSKAIRSAKVIAFDDLGMEAIHELVVENMPVTVAVTTQGESVHNTGPAEWRVNIANLKKK